MGNPSPITLPPSPVVLHPAMPAMPLTLATPHLAGMRSRGKVSHKRLYGRRGPQELGHGVSQG
jgi:hypothetical protein